MMLRAIMAFGIGPNELIDSWKDARDLMGQTKIPSLRASAVESRLEFFRARRPLPIRPPSRNVPFLFARARVSAVKNSNGVIPFIAFVDPMNM